MTNTEKILNAIRQHPAGLDDDELADITGVQPRQQIHQICTRIAGAGQIRRESIEKPGKRRKIHNFPASAPPPLATNAPHADTDEGKSWHRTLSALVAATRRTEDDLLQEALQDLALKVLKATTTT